MADRRRGSAATVCDTDWVFTYTKPIQTCSPSIFTVPYELNSLIYENQELLYNLMLRCATDTLLTLCRDNKHLGTTPGIVSVLHTQGQRLNFHPHIHAMLSGGGLISSGQFAESAHKGHLLPKVAMVRRYIFPFGYHSFSARRTLTV